MKNYPRLPLNPNTAVVIVVVIIAAVVATTAIIRAAVRIKLSPVFFCLSDCFSTLEFFFSTLTSRLHFLEFGG